MKMIFNLEFISSGLMENKDRAGHLMELCSPHESSTLVHEILPLASTDQSW